MKPVSIILLLLCTSLSFGQSNEIIELEKSLSQKKGINLVEAQLQLSELYYFENRFSKSADYAKSAYTIGKQLNGKYIMALALNREAQALLKISTRKSVNRNAAIRKLRESIKLTDDKPLKLENLEILKGLAIDRNKQKELAQIENQIAIINGESPTEIAAAEKKEKGLFKFRNKAREMKQDNDELSGQVEELNREKEKLRRQSSSLKYMVRQKEAAIQDMTEEQMMQELLFVEQERLLDSLIYTRMVDSLILSQKDSEIQRNEAELSEQKAQLALQNSQRNLLLSLAGIILLVAFGLYSRYRGMREHNAVLEEKNKIIVEEKQRSEELLLNILPHAIAEELKLNGQAKTKHYERATVLFTDFKNFSQIASEISPEALVQDLDYCFKEFDKIIGKYGLEKIKTIGDAYMCAGGLPSRNPMHPEQVVRAALEIQQFLMQWKLEKVEKGERYFEARLGIHTGPIIAGVVGAKKFAYDIWGDTVNIASRMESSGEIGRVNISSKTYELIKNDFDCEYRGKVPAKNIGEIDMYFVKEV